MKQIIQIKYPGINFWGLLIGTVFVGLDLFGVQTTAVAIWIVLVIEYLTQEIRRVERPLRELADFANENKQRTP